MGKGVLKAVKNVESVIAPALKGMDVTQQEAIDKKMMDLDGTPNKTNLGAVRVMAVSPASLCHCVTWLFVHADLFSPLPSACLLSCESVIRGVRVVAWRGVSTFQPPSSSVLKAMRISRRTPSLPFPSLSPRLVLPLRAFLSTSILPISLATPASSSCPSPG